MQYCNIGILEYCNIGIMEYLRHNHPPDWVGGYNKVKGGRLRRPPFREMYIFESKTKSAIFCHDSLHLLRFGRLKTDWET